MTSDEIRSFVTRYVELTQHENLTALIECYTDNARIESPMFHTIHGRKDIEKSFNNLFRAFDEWDFRIGDILVDESGDRAALVYTVQATHRGDLFGMPGTGRRAEVSGVYVFGFENGRIASEKRLYDFTGLLVQLGVLKAKAV